MHTLLQICELYKFDFRKGLHTRKSLKREFAYDS